MSPDVAIRTPKTTSQTRRIAVYYPQNTQKGAAAMKRLIELGKDLLIVLLICSLILLAVTFVPLESIRNSPSLSRLAQPFAPLLGLSEAELTYVETALPVLDAAQPVAISAHHAESRATALWDFDALDAAFETYGGLLGQAMDTAELFAEATDSQILTALTGSSIYFRYSTSLPVPLLASWLGAELNAQLPEICACILSLEQDSVALYLLGVEACFRSETQVQPETLAALLEQIHADGSRFSFESGASASALSLLPGGSIAVPGAAVSNPCDSRYTDQLATELDFNPYGETRFTDDEGTMFYTEANCALEISASGTILLTSSAPDRFLAASASDEALVELARQLVDAAVGNVVRDGRIYLSGLTRQEDATVCTFDYLVSGIPVVLPGHAATITFSGASLTRLELQVYTFAFSGQSLYPLPAAQTMAILPAGSELTLQYCINPDKTLAVGWKR